jgi:ketosteroid isomerase-like protein
MSQENVEIIRRHHAAFISGNRDGAFEPLDPEIEFVFRLFELPTARGHAEVEEAIRQWIGTWRPRTYRFEPSDYRGLGDKVLVRCTEYGLGRESGVEVRREAFQLWDMRDGKAIRCEVFDREADALQAAGLRDG